MVFGVVFERRMEESSVAEGPKVEEKLSGGRVAQGVFGIVKILIVLGDPSRREKAMFCGDVMTEGVSEVSSSVGGDGFI